MALPASWITVAVSATYFNPNGSPAQGSVEATAVRAVGMDDAVVLPAPQSFALNASGATTLQLPCPNDAGAGFTSLVYRITERIQHGRAPYHVQVDAAMPASVQLAHLPEVDAAPPRDWHATLEGIAAAAAGSASAAAQSVATGGVFPTTAAGLLATSPGELFGVMSADDAEYTALYLNNGGVAQDTGKRYPSAALVDVLRATDTAIKDAGTAVQSGSADVRAWHVDANRRVLLGFDSAAGEVIAAGLVNQAGAADAARGVLAGASMALYTGTAYAPVYTDAHRRILSGYDVANAAQIGAGAGGGSGSVVHEPLPTADRPIAKAINHLLFYGQSLSVGAQSTPVLSTAQPYSNVTFAGGPRAWDGAAMSYAPLKPLVEDAINPAHDAGSGRGETPCSGAANYATTLAALDGHLPTDHIILASTAGHGGWTVAQLKKGTNWYNDVFLEHIRQAHAVNPNYAVHVVGWAQGENDSSGGTTFATYRADLLQLQIDAEADIKAITGQTSPVYFLTYQTRALNTANPAPALAQLDLCKTSDRFILATPIYHLPRASDGTHLTNTGSKWMSAYFGRAYKQLVIDGVRPRWLNPLSATRRGNVVRVRFDVPHAPMMLDATSIPLAQDHGFAVQDSGGAVAISNVAVDGSDAVLTLAATPAGATTVRYALDHIGAGMTINNGASSNLRDSAPERITIGGTELPLYNWAPAFSLPVIPLGE